MASVRKTAKFSTWEIDGVGKSSTHKKPENKPNKANKPASNDNKTKDTANDKGGKKETGLSLSVKKDEDFSTWYTEVITRSEMIDYSDMSGC